MPGELAVVSGLLRAAVRVLTDDELVGGPARWRTFADPFGALHTDPCDERPGDRVDPVTEGRGDTRG